MSQGINIPGSILDELKTKDYSTDSRFEQNDSSTKRKRQISRKDKRKQEKEDKKKKKRRVQREKINYLKEHKQDRAQYKNNDKKIKHILKNNSNDSRKEKKTVKFGQNQIKEFHSEVSILSGDDNDDLVQDSDEQDSEEYSDFAEDEELSDLDESMSVDDTMAALKALKNKKNSKILNEALDSLGSEESDIDSEDFSDDMELDDSMSVEETLAALKASKAGKGKTATHSVTRELSNVSSENELDIEEEDELEESEQELDDSLSVEETMAALKAMKDKKKKEVNSSNTVKDSKKKSRKRQEEPVDFITPLTPEERAAIERDEMDMQYYAKKLGLKGSSKKIQANDEFDAIGGLLEGLDYFEEIGKGDQEYGDFAHDSNKPSEIDSSESSGSEEEEQEEDEDDEREEEEVIENPFSSDDELDSDDFDEFGSDDLDPEELDQLRELEGGKKKSHKKENPYAAPVESGSYVPPSMRKCELDATESSEMKEIRKKVKSLLNKLSESNLVIIVNSLNDMYDSGSRQNVTQAIIEQIMEIVGQKNKLLDGFTMLYSAVIFALWKERGNEIGAMFTQNAVEVFIQYYETEMENFSPALTENTNEDTPRLISKECFNIVTMLAYCYNFGLLSCKLIYSLISEFIKYPNEFTTELLMKVISVSGPLIRGDDPTALKDILSQLLANCKILKTQSPRLKFLLDTLADLKNNRLKPSVLSLSNSKLKKTIQGSIKSSFPLEPLQVSLDDIKNINTKGKWWLVGASWRGNMNEAFEEANNNVKIQQNNQVSDIALDDTLLNDLPDWEAISREQRMNTDVRRAIFISIMSAHDYMDAFAKLEKLNLKNKQSLDIPKVLLRCLTKDGISNQYNPYYALVASKLSEHHHNLQKSFQFLFWDVVKKLEEDTNDNSDSEEELDAEIDEDTKIKNISSQANFFGSLLSEGVLNLECLKHVPMMAGLNTDGIIFLEIFLYRFLLSEARKAETKNKKNSDSKKKYTYKAAGLSNKIENLKPDNRKTVLEGLNWFLSKHFRYDSFINFPKDTKDYKREKRRLEWAIPAFKSVINETLKAFNA